MALTEGLRSSVGRCGAHGMEQKGGRTVWLGCLGGHFPPRAVVRVASAGLVLALEKQFSATSCGQRPCFGSASINAGFVFEHILIKLIMNT